MRRQERKSEARLQRILKVCILHSTSESMLVTQEHFAASPPSVSPLSPSLQTPNRTASSR